MFSFVFYNLTSCIFSFVFYSSVKAIIEAVYRWFHFSKYRQCLITAPVIPTACLYIQYSSYAYTRSMHQLLVYKALTNQGEAHQYIDHVVCINTEDSHHRLKEHTILHVFRAPRHDSLIPLNWYQQIVILYKAF